MRTGWLYYRYMPLPRFHRLPAARQAEILQVARTHFARDGTEAASYNKIITAVGISKTAAYQYFDGKDDLLSSVLADLGRRLLECLGPWTETATAAEFWRQLTASSQRLRGHLAEHPDDVALLDAATARAAEAGAEEWLTAAVANGRALGVIRADIDPELLVMATAAVFRAADAWVLDALRAGRSTGSDEQTWTLLAGLWGSPTARSDDDQN